MSVSSKRYSIVEPHPSVPSSHYFTTGRGGAGNAVKAPSSVTRGADATGPASRVALSLVPSSSSSCSAASQHSTSALSSSPPNHLRKTFTSGRGGAGNVYPASERAIFSFDEELERQLSFERHAAPVYHVGRGGAGNVSSSSSSSSHFFSSSSSSAVGIKPPTTTATDRSALFGAPQHQHQSFFGRRRPSEDSEVSWRSSESESGADAFNRSVKKGWKKMMGVGA